MDEQLNFCPNCFEKLYDKLDRCPHCSYSLGSRPKKNKYELAPMTIIADRYLIGKVLGSGGFGITYKVKDIITDEICALKEYMPLEFAYRNDNDPTVHCVEGKNKTIFNQGRAGFLDEAKILMKFRNEEHVVHAQNYFSSNNTAYLAMEFLDGINFKRFINKMNGKVPLNIANEVFITVANTISKIHSKNIVHRDISPENIFITSDGMIKLIDFGSAKNQMSREMPIFLKPGFAPPEQYSGTAKQGPWTDIYSLAATYYMSLTALPIPDAKKRAQNDTLERLDKICPDVSENVGKIIEKALKLDAKERYQSVDDLLSDLSKESTVDGSHEPPDRSRAYVYLARTKYNGAWNVNKKIPLENNVVYKFGRSYQMCDYVIDMADYVSRCHCTIMYSPNDKCFYVRDMSANGTYFQNGRGISKNVMTKIEPGNIIFLGSEQTAIRLVVE